MVTGLLLLLNLPLVILAQESGSTSTRTCDKCDSKDVCYGGDTGLRLEDAFCISKNSCNMTYRADACNLCFVGASADTSDYKDCTGQCYAVGDEASMLVVDDCGVCGGGGETCNPQISTIRPNFLPSGQAAKLELTGMGFRTPDLQVVVLSKVTSGRVLQVAKIERVQSAHSMTININQLEKGRYDIGARTGATGEDYKKYDVPELLVYRTSDFVVDDISPTNYDLVRTPDSLPVMLHIDTGTSESLATFAGNMACIIGNDTLVAGKFSVQNSTLSCSVAKPNVSMGMDICVTFNGVHIIGCKTLAIFAPAPRVLEENAIKFSPKADQMSVTFNVAVRHLEDLNTRNCSFFFRNVTELGRGAECTWSASDTVLTATIGEGATIGPDSVLVLKPGIRDANAQYSRVTDAITLTTVTAGIRPVAIAPRGVWPETLTTYAKNPLTLGFYVVYAPGGRPPVSIHWSVNGVIQDAFSGSYVLTIDVTSVGQYNVSVTVTDAFGGSGTVKQTITKFQSLVPNVMFRPVSRLWIRPDSSFVTNPNTEFVIGTRVSFVETAFSSLDNFTFQWFKNDNPAGIGFSYRASKTEISTDLCGESVVFKLKVSEKSDPTSITETSVTVHVECRDPVARISGSRLVEVPMHLALRVNIDGETQTFDPDGGKLTYSWTCTVQVYSNKRNCITHFQLEDQSTTPWLRFSNSKFKKSLNNVHVITLTVTTVKNGKNYTATATVQYIPRDTPVPWVRWVTLQHEYRSNALIVVRAHVGLKVDVQWRFVSGRQEYGYVDLNDRDVYQEKKVVEGYAWCIIRPDKLSPGQRYLLELKVTNASVTTAVATSTFEIYIYRKLRLCTLHANPLVELEEATLTLHGCASDEHVQSIEATCRLGEREITMDEDLTFIVPRFADRDTSEAKFKCSVRDDVGHVMHVESDMVTITLQTDVDKALNDKTTELETEGNYVELVKVMSDNIGGSEMKRNAQQKNIVDGIKNVIVNKPTPREIARTLKAVNKLGVRDMKETEVISSLARHILSMLSSLCGETISSRTEDLTKEDIMGLISRARELASKVRSTNKLYRAIQEKIACIKVRRLAIETQDDIMISERSVDGSAGNNESQGDGARMRESAKARYLVGSLDNVRDKGVQIDFPEELKKKYRDQYACVGEVMCDGVGLVVEEHRQIEPPDIQTGRKDMECMTYTFVDLYNPRTGAKLVVNDLRERIGIEFETQCPRAECWYYEKGVDKFSQSGVTTSTRMRSGDTAGTEEGAGTVMTVICETSHLSCFTLHSEHVGDDSLNLVLILGLTFGLLFLLVSMVILIRAYVIARRKKSAKDKGDYSVEYERTS